MEDQSRWSRMTFPATFHLRHRMIVKAAEIQSGMRVLEVACGNGEVSILAAIRGAVVHATDIHSVLLENARQNAADHGVEITFSVADMRELDGVDGPYDCVLGAAALHHLDEAGARQAVQAAISVLAHNGRALFLEPTANVPWFETIKCLFPTSAGRPSSLNRRAWKRWLSERDDRWMSDAELLGAWPNARIVARMGLLARIKRAPMIHRLDAWLLRWAVLHRFAQAAVVQYRT